MSGDHPSKHAAAGHSCCSPPGPGATAIAAHDHHHQAGTHTLGHASGHAHTKHAAQQVENGVLDPVCGMTVDPHSTSHRYEYAGRPFYFCSNGCRTKFMADPQKYLGDRPGSTPAVPEGTIYTCPMHPEVRQVGPGSCPICGMALEPVLVSAEQGPNVELIDMNRRFWIGLVLSLPVVALEMGGHLTGLGHYVSQSTSNWIQMILATPVVLWGGLAVFRARLAIAAHPQFEHVHAHRHGDRRCLGIQHRCHAHAGDISGSVSHQLAAPSRCTSKPRR